MHKIFTFLLGTLFIITLSACGQLDPNILNGAQVDQIQEVVDESTYVGYLGGVLYSGSDKKGKWFRYPITLNDGSCITLDLTEEQSKRMKKNRGAKWTVLGILEDKGGEVGSHSGKILYDVFIVNEE